MFQIEPILFLQSFESAALNAFFNGINTVGYSFFHMTIILVILFGLNFRKGFYILQVLLWTGFVTTFLKEYFALPRPSEVDLNVKFINEDYSNPTKFESMGASHFLGELPQQVVAHFRTLENYSYGLPSGHASTTTAVWGAIYTVFQHRWVRTLSIALIVLMPLTRMYLGRHFLADVLGGTLIGTVFVLFFYFAVYKSDAIRESFVQKVACFSITPKTVLKWAYFLILPFIMYWILPQEGARGAGLFLGVNVGFMLLTMWGLPLDGGSILQKILRILFAAVFFHVPNFLLQSLGLDDMPLHEFVRVAASSFSMIYFTTELSLKLRLYDREGAL